jgi:hypothetical protein
MYIQHQQQGVALLETPSLHSAQHVDRADGSHLAMTPLVYMTSADG